MFKITLCAQNCEYEWEYFRYILLIRMSRDTSNCVQHVFEKNIYFIMIFPPILNYYSPMKASTKGSTMHIYFHSILWSYLVKNICQGYQIILTTCVCMCVYIYIYIYIYIYYYYYYFFVLLNKGA